MKGIVSSWWSRGRALVHGLLRTSAGERAYVRVLNSEICGSCRSSSLEEKTAARCFSHIGRDSQKSDSPKRLRGEEAAGDHIGPGDSAPHNQLHRAAAKESGANEKGGTMVKFTIDM